LSGKEVEGSDSRSCPVADFSMWCSTTSECVYMHITVWLKQGKFCYWNDATWSHCSRRYM